MTASNIARLNAFGFHPNITKVVWGGGYFVVVEVLSNYIEVLDGPVRLGDLSISDDKIGELLAQQNINQAETMAHAKRLRFIGVIKIKSLPENPTLETFHLTLAGASRKNELRPGGTVTYFCGTTSAFRDVRFTTSEIPLFSTDALTWTNLGLTYTNHRYALFTTVSWSFSNPANSGSGSESWIVNSVTGSFGNPYVNPSSQNYSSGGTSQQAWYLGDDGLNHMAQPYMLCSEIPPPGDPQPSSVFEGFDSIRVLVIGAGGMIMRPEVEWTYETNVNEFVIPDPDAETFDGARKSETVIGRIKAGETEDHVPKYDDLPNGVYEFMLERMAFKNIPLPPDDDGNPAPPDAPPFKAPVAWPLTLPQVRYSFTVQGPKPDFLDYLTPYTTEDYNLFLPAGVHPPDTQTFVT